MSEPVDFPSRICKNELCELEGIHLSHKLTPCHLSCPVCVSIAGELCVADERSCERMCGMFHFKRIRAARGHSPKPFKGMRDPWLAPSVEALDESIVRACSDCVPRVLVQLAPIIENDYGRIAPTQESAFRRLQRRITRLCEAGQLLRIDLGRRLFAYVSPQARMYDLNEVRELIMENSWYTESLWHTS